MRKIGIIALSICLIGIVATAIAVPVALTSANKEKNKDIKKIEITTDLQDDFVEIYFETGNDEIDIQTLINNKSNNWLKWVNPINGANEIDKEAISKIDSVTFVNNETTGKAGLEFKITWKNGTKLPENLKTGYSFEFGMVDDNFSLPWKSNLEDATAKIQDIVNKGGIDGVYASAAKISEELNDPKNQKAIIDLVDSSAEGNKIRKATVDINAGEPSEDGLIIVEVLIIYSMEDLTRIASTPHDELIQIITAITVPTM